MPKTCAMATFYAYGPIGMAPMGSLPLFGFESEF
jgi:hypothetical protein